MFYSFEDLLYDIEILESQIQERNQEYDYIAPVVRGGLIAGTMLSHRLNIPLLPVTVSLRDNGLKFIDEKTIAFLDKKHCLLVDDIIDSGATIKEIYNQVNSIYHHDTACLIWNIDLNEDPDLSPDYCARTLSRETHKEWIDFFWEK